MQYFYINQGSTLNHLKIELVNDGIYGFETQEEFNNRIQNAVVTFSMWDERGNLKISDAPCEIVEARNECSDNFIIVYKWKKRDTKECGQFKGCFKIHFNDDLVNNGLQYEGGDLIVPIQEDLMITVK